MNLAAGTRKTNLSVSQFDSSWHIAKNTNNMDTQVLHWNVRGLLLFGTVAPNNGKQQLTCCADSGVPDTLRGTPRAHHTRISWGTQHWRESSVLSLPTETVRYRRAQSISTPFLSLYTCGTQGWNYDLWNFCEKCAFLGLKTADEHRFYFDGLCLLWLTELPQMRPMPLLWTKLLLN